jgi:hypothetical protein
LNNLTFPSVGYRVIGMDVHRFGWHALEPVLEICHVVWYPACVAAHGSFPCRRRRRTGEASLLVHTNERRYRGEHMFCISWSRWAMDLIGLKVFGKGRVCHMHIYYFACRVPVVDKALFSRSWGELALCVFRFVVAVDCFVLIFQVRLALGEEERRSRGRVRQRRFR